MDLPVATKYPEKGRKEVEPLKELEREPEELESDSCESEDEDDQTDWAALEESAEEYSSNTEADEDLDAVNTIRYLFTYTDLSDPYVLTLKTFHSFISWFKTWLSQTFIMKTFPSAIEFSNTTINLMYIKMCPNHSVLLIPF